MSVLPDTVMCRASGCQWRLLWSGRLPAAENMAVDEAVAAGVAAGDSPPVLRIYGWSPPAVSLGYAQALDEGVDVAAIRRRGYGLVRRPTGGRAIIHHDEVTYSVAIRADALARGGSVAASYREISRGVEAGLERLGIPARVSARKRKPSGRAAELPAVCFAGMAGGDMSVAGRKIVGSAQMRREGVILQHGSIPIRMDIQEHLEILAGGGEDAGSTERALARAVVGVADALGREVSFEELGRAVVAGFAEAFEARFDETELTAVEVARSRELLAEKYGCDAWTRSAGRGASRG